MAEVTSGELTVIVLDADEADALAALLELEVTTNKSHHWNCKSHQWPELGSLALGLS